MAAGLPPFPKRYRVIIIFAAVTFTIIYFFSSISASTPSSVRDHIPHNPFREPKHKPPVQTNSTDGESKWHADWRWTDPFSRDVTKDDQRAVLPHLRKRPPVYTFYEDGPDKIVNAAEQRILFQWRRAWWAQGFKPVVLGRADAKQSPLYKRVQQLQVQDNIEKELMRWLAWGNMGGGILADWTTFPMSEHNNALLTFLRRGKYPKLSRFQNLKSGLYCGDKKLVEEALSKAVDKPDIKKVLSLADPAFNDLFTIDDTHAGIAVYDSDTILKKYTPIADVLFKNNRAKGLGMLSEMINSHLHSTFQSSFSEIVVLKPLPKYTTLFIEPAVLLAESLRSCPIGNPIEGSCPPNRPNCRRCSPSHLLPVSTPPSVHNSTDKFYVGTVPHPYTTTSLTNNEEHVTPSYIRRLKDQKRNIWVETVTKDATKNSKDHRISVFKLAVASDWAIGRTLWVTAEDNIVPEDMQWIFGFSLPPVTKEALTKQTPNTQDSRLEQRLFDKAKLVVKSSGGDNQRNREAVEAWNLGDIEAWRFVRAYAARKVLVRKQWEKEECRFAGAEPRDETWMNWR